MKNERILITVKTYPTLSSTHIELVCTAGIREDGSWIRIYPVPFRFLEGDRKFSKWRWVELPLIKREKDTRPESHSPIDRHKIDVLEEIGTHDNWRQRKELILEKGTVWTNMTELICAAKRNDCSLATFKPTKIEFQYNGCEREWDENKLAAAQNQMSQRGLFEEDAVPENFRIAAKVPYEFSYKITDDDDRVSILKILDWEIGMLYWNCLKIANGDEKAALSKVYQKYGEEFLNKDIHLFLGTSLQWHNVGPNPWMIIGVFHPPIQKQMSLGF